ncbi:MAG: sulfite exporter TauE/SafE family protein [Flavobacteriales bacterium]|nr:sulfite exporter TauE/SafE family protein [Flavobacteriales bacterium]
MEFIVYIYAILGGLVAGFINTLAGSGSLITLPILMIMLGLPAGIANGTNRLGVVLQTIVSVITLKKKGAFDASNHYWLIVPAVMGAIPGAMLAADMTDESLRYTIGGVMLLMLIPVLMNTSKWLKEHSDDGHASKKWYVILAFFFIGAYGGFIQAGVGIFLLSGMVLLAQLTMSHANALKNLIVLCFSIPALIVFLYNDQVDWKLGLLMASGQMLGGWSAARFAMDVKGANVWIRRLLIVMIVAATLNLFGIFDLFKTLLSA